MRSRALPRILDFFPHTRRGHGSTRPGTCVADGCMLNRHQKTGSEKVNGELHDDQKANVAAWREEHGFGEHTPLEFCHSRETERAHR